MREYNKKHVDAISARLREYEKVLALREFNLLPWCDVCDTAKGKGGSCGRCLFAVVEPDGEIISTCGDGCYGASCRTKTEQRQQFKFLLGQLSRNGYEFK
jgi:hypothetical protein